jgi:hypothetical protein
LGNARILVHNTTEELDKLVLNEKKLPKSPHRSHRRNDSGTDVQITSFEQFAKMSVYITP